MIAVAAAVVARAGRMLIARRPQGKHMGGLFEFPGGKLEQGEQPEEALARELREELDVRVRVGMPCLNIAYSYPEKDVLLMFYRAEVISGEPKPIEEAEVMWIDPDTWRQYDWAPVDRLFLERLGDEGLRRIVTI